MGGQATRIVTCRRPGKCHVGGRRGGWSCSFVSDGCDWLVSDMLGQAPLALHALAWYFLPLISHSIKSLPTYSVQNKEVQEHGFVTAQIRWLMEIDIEVEVLDKPLLRVLHLFEICQGRKPQRIFGAATASSIQPIPV